MEQFDAWNEFVLCERSAKRLGSLESLAPGHRLRYSWNVEPALALKNRTVSYEYS